MGLRLPINFCRPNEEEKKKTTEKTKQNHPKKTNKTLAIYYKKIRNEGKLGCVFLLDSIKNTDTYKLVCVFMHLRKMNYWNNTSKIEGCNF